MVGFTTTVEPKELVVLEEQAEAALELVDLVARAEWELEGVDLVELGELELELVVWEESVDWEALVELDLGVVVEEPAAWEWAHLDLSAGQWVARVVVVASPELAVFCQEGRKVVVPHRA